VSVCVCVVTCVCVCVDTGVAVIDGAQHWVVECT
jgi:hypothetical protein